MIFFVPLWAHVPIREQPWANYAIIFLTIAVSWWCVAWEQDALTLAGFEEDVASPWTPGGMEGLPRLRRILPAPVSALTSTLVHAGSLHLLGNMLFLWVFGNAVNSRLGHGKYVALYLVSGLMAGTLHAVMDASPVVGASGAINGVVAAFLVCFPRKNITMFVWVFGLIRPQVAPVPGIWIIPFWLIWDMLMLLIGSGGVAHWAHVGGFVTGFLLAMLLLAAGWVRPRTGEQTLLQLVGLGRAR